jgi:mannose-6-phosphate isomerase
LGAIRLSPRAVEKPWGRHGLPSGLVGAGADARIGEIWFEDVRGGAAAPLLVKYLFTSESLSVQVHPDDDLARAAGLTGGKDEAWLVLEADPAAQIGIGLRQPVERAALLEAALDGSIEQLLDWRAAAPGSFHHLPAGTVHALGAGVTLVEIQQNADITYRLYDYGRPRQLHVDKAIEAARLQQAPASLQAPTGSPDRAIMVEGGSFVVEIWSGPRAATLIAGDADLLWAVPLEGDAIVAGTTIKPGEAWLVEGEAPVALDRAGALLLAYPGSLPRGEIPAG